MPTPEQVKKNQTIRSAFLASLYDLEPLRQDGLGLCSVEDVLDSMSASDLSHEQITLLVNSLERAGMVEGAGMSAGDSHLPEVRLTTEGRKQVEDWVNGGDVTTPNLPVTYKTFVTTVHNPQGTVVNVASDNAQIIVNNHLSDALKAVAAKSRELLHQADLDDATSLELADDVQTLEEQAASQRPNTCKIKAALGRLGRGLTSAVTAGASAAINAEVQEGISQVLQLL